jgi:hypothetical protein
MLPTDEIIRKAITPSTITTIGGSGGPLIPLMWAARIETNLRKMAVLQDSVYENLDLLVPGAGSTVTIPLLPDLAQAVAQTDGTDISSVLLNGQQSVPLTPVEYAQAVEMTRGALDVAKYDLIAEILDRLTYSMTLRIEGNIAATAALAVPSVGGNFTFLYPNTKIISTITAADIFTDKQILQGVKILESVNNHPFPNGLWRLYIGPKQWLDLMQDADTRNDLRWSQQSVLISGGPRVNGPRAILHNCEIYVTNYCPTANEGAGSAIPVVKALLVAPRWTAIAWKRKPELVVDPTLYDFGRRRRFAITAGFDAEPLHSERAVIMTSAA